MADGSVIKLEIGSPSLGRLAVLDELKGLAMILVILYHAGGVLAWSNTLHGDLGVDIFVILSGIGLAYGSRYQGVGNFLARRLCRVFPAYWVALLLFWACDVHFLQKSYTPFDLSIHVLGIHGWFGDVYGLSINDSFWYMTLIVSLYLIYCACYRLLDSPGWLLLAGSLVSLAIALAYFYTGQSGMFSHFGLRLPGFFVGLLIGRLLKQGHLGLKPLLPLAAGIFVLTYVPYVLGFVFINVAIGLALMASYLFIWKRVATPALEQRSTSILTFFGVYSLEIFLIHQPLIREYNFYVYGRFLHDPTPSPGSLIFGMVIGMAITLAVSVELHKLLQKIPMPGSRALS
jgi:peptidoglycan/LPS O-acetylase OafA/YrhL